jgi:GDP-L-fucose synthase
MRPYNLGYGSTVTIGDIVDTILKVTGKSPIVEWDNSKPTTIPYRMVSTERITSELGFKPDYSFEDGIRETIEWYKNNE